MGLFSGLKTRTIMPELNDYATSQKAARILGYHANRIRRMVRNGHAILALENAYYALS
jgi:hypothetical protein